MTRCCRLAVIGLALGLVACHARAVGGTPGGDAGPDAAPISDATIPPPDAATCTTTEPWYWEPASVDTLYAEPDVTAEGQTVRLFVGVLYDGCYRFGGAAASVDPATREIVVWSYLLRRPASDGCIGELAYSEEILVYGALAPGTWTARPLSGGSPPFDFEVTACPAGDDCLCSLSTPNLPFGTPCTYQCDCQWPNVCVYYRGIGGLEYRECYPSCSDDAQCAPGYACTSYDDGPTGVCQPMFTGPVPVLCQSNAECGPYESCFAWPDGARSCEPSAEGFFDFDYARCDCDEQCGPLACIAATGEDMFWNECHRPCRGDRDCPPGLWACGLGSPWAEPVCYFIGE